jgi:hypothetical protein
VHRSEDTVVKLKGETCDKAVIDLMYQELIYLREMKTIKSSSHNFEGKEVFV